MAAACPSDLKLGEQIGRGSYGSVFTATYGDRRVAVKAVPTEDSAEGDALKGELQAEIKMLRECDSQWIVRYFGCLAKGGMLWICMEREWPPFEPGTHRSADPVFAPCSARLQRRFGLGHSACDRCADARGRDRDDRRGDGVGPALLAQDAADPAP